MFLNQPYLLRSHLRGREEVRRGISVGFFRTVEIPGVLPVVSVVIKCPKKGHWLTQAEWFKTCRKGCCGKLWTSGARHRWTWVRTCQQVDKRIKHIHVQQVHKQKLAGMCSWSSTSKEWKSVAFEHALLQITSFTVTTEISVEWDSLLVWRSKTLLSLKTGKHKSAASATDASIESFSMCPLSEGWKEWDNQHKGWPF